MQDLNQIKLHSYSNIIVLDGNKVKELDVDNYRLMKDADALISDYSSVTFDYLHLNRPIAYTLDDKDDYKNGFIVENPETLMAGPQLFTIDDFYAFISDVEKIMILMELVEKNCLTLFLSIMMVIVVND